MTKSERSCAPAAASGETKHQHKQRAAAWLVGGWGAREGMPMVLSIPRSDDEEAAAAITRPATAYVVNFILSETGKR